MILQLVALASVFGQADTITQKPVHPNADDPSQFLTRVEIFNAVSYTHLDVYKRQVIMS